jgi:hypothetical protein
VKTVDLNIFHVKRWQRLRTKSLFPVTDRIETAQRISKRPQVGIMKTGSAFTPYNQAIGSVETGTGIF